MDYLLEMIKDCDNGLDNAFEQLQKHIEELKSSKDKRAITIIKGFLEETAKGMENVNSLFSNDTDDKYIQQMKNSIKELDKILKEN